jgi:very-short-patch-repair endonuclease
MPAREEHRRKRVAFARHVRHYATPAERALWPLLRGRRLDGVKFRRQAILLGYVVDFYAPKVGSGLIIELDGPVHDADDEQARAQRRQDHVRDAQLRRAGFTVIRIPNDQVLDDPEGTLAFLRALIADPELRYRVSSGEPAEYPDPPVEHQ